MYIILNTILIPYCKVEKLHYYAIKVNMSLNFFFSFQTLSCNSTKECRAIVSRIIGDPKSLVISTAEEYNDAANLVKKLVDNSNATAEEKKKV